jgi:hypothetical protein
MLTATVEAIGSWRIAEKIWMTRKAPIARSLKNGRMTMAEYIDKDIAVKGLRMAHDVDGANFVENIPAADVRENVKGEWIQHYETTSDNETLPYGWECSLCRRWEIEKQPFCNCGAHMVGGAEDD